MDNEDRKSLIDSYYEAIILLHEEESIKNALPSTEFNNFSTIINGLIVKLQNEIQSILIESKNCSKEEIEELIKPEIQELKNKVLICRELKRKEEKRNEEEEEVDNKSSIVPQKELIFATTPRGNICVEEDIKDLPKEHYDKIIKCLEKIERNEEDNNNEKGKLFNNNKKLIGVREKKEDIIRITLRHLTPDTAYVELVKMKKTNNSDQDREGIINRDKLVYDEYLELKEEMKDETRKKEIIENNHRIRERILNTLSLSKGEQK